MLFIYIVVIFLFTIALWMIQNNQSKKELKKAICLEGYYERFNDNDRILRVNQTLDSFINSCRILYPWEMLLFFFKKYAIFIHPKPKIIIFDPKFENGFPHTHGNFILASSLSQLSKTTFKHEQIHIYQRYNPFDVNKEICKTWRIKGIYYKHDNQRANPDTNTIRYESFDSKYIKDPVSLSDIENKKDHPYEDMAYKLQN